MPAKTLLIAFSMILASSSVFAQNRFINCQSEVNGVPNLEIELNGNSFVETRMNGQVMWTFTETSVSAPAKEIFVLDTTDFTKALILKANAKESIETATLIVSTDSTGTILEQLETIADDGSGYAMVEYKNKKGETTNGAIFAGWGGFYNKCKSVK